MSLLRELCAWGALPELLRVDAPIVLGRLDARVSYQLNDNLGIFAEVENINDEPGHEYQGGNTDWVTGYELYDYTAYVGITGRW